MPRKPVELDKEQFEKLCELQCTQKEICSWFDITDKTLTRWCKRTYGMGFQMYLKSNAVKVKSPCAVINSNRQKQALPWLFGWGNSG